MSKDELLAKLRQIAERQVINDRFGDQELDHMEADDNLLEFINDPLITDAYKRIQKWYA